MCLIFITFNYFTKKIPDLALLKWKLVSTQGLIYTFNFTFLAGCTLHFSPFVFVFVLSAKASSNTIDISDYNTLFKSRVRQLLSHNVERLAKYAKI